MEDSKEYAKKHRDNFYHEVISGKNVDGEKEAIFMAGSPGAGKTEVATELVSFYQNMCLIDADRFREGFLDIMVQILINFNLEHLGWLVMYLKE